MPTRTFATDARIDGITLNDLNDLNDHDVPGGEGDLERSRVDAVRFGALLAALWAAHDLADHVLRTDHQAIRKAGCWRVMAGHVGAYHALQVAVLGVLCGAGIRPGWRRTAAAVALSAATHAVLDRCWPVQAIMRATRSPGFAQTYWWEPPAPFCGEQNHGSSKVPTLLHGPYLAARALHHAVLAAAAAILAGGAR